MLPEMLAYFAWIVVVLSVLGGVFLAADQLSQQKVRVPIRIRTRK
jgi:hypothetical protein